MWTRARSEGLPGGAKIILTPLIGVPNAQFTLPARYDKTFLFDCSERVQTSDFLSVGDSLELSGIQFTPRTRHRQDSFVVWRDGVDYRAPTKEVVGPGVGCRGRRTQASLARNISGGSVAEWIECWTQAQKGLGSNRSRDAVW